MLDEWVKQHGEIGKTREDLLEAEATLAPLQEKHERFQAWQSRETDRKAAAKANGVEASAPTEDAPPAPTQQDRNDRDTWMKLERQKRDKLASLETAMFAEPPHVTIEDVDARWEKVTGDSAKASSAAKAESLLNLEV